MARILTEETIAAIASPTGASPRVVIRLSGREAFGVLDCVFKHSLAKPSKAFRRYEGHVTLPDWPPVPAAAYIFIAPRSYTRENMVELHTIGSPPFVSALMRVLHNSGARQARAGEFTRRAFLNGRIDLTQAEAVLAMTSSEQHQHVRLAARTLEGGIRERIDKAKDKLLELAAYVEAGIDFSEDEIDLLPIPEAISTLLFVKDLLRDLERRSARFQVHRDEPIVALQGQANAGKSTLLNRLLGEERAITSQQAGTTRDVIGAPCQFQDVRVRLLDVAGLKNAVNDIEQQALDKARLAVEQADLVIQLLTPEDLDALPDNEPNLLLVLNKVDTLPSETKLPTGILAISALTGQGIDSLISAIAAHFKQHQDNDVHEFVTTARQLGLFDECKASIDHALESMELMGGECWELASVDIRAALDALGEITGVVATDDILDAIFGRFCIGK